MTLLVGANPDAVAGHSLLSYRVRTLAPVRVYDHLFFRLLTGFSNNRQESAAKTIVVPVQNGTFTTSGELR